MFEPGTRVVTMFDVKENPWATAGTVSFHHVSESDLIPVEWPENDGRVSWEDAWTLVQVVVGGRAPNPDAADLAADRAGL